MKLRYAAFAFALTLPAHGAAQMPAAATSAKAAPANAEALAGIDALIEGALKEWNAPGLAVAVVRDGKVILAKGYGVRDPATGQPMDKDTIFPIGSMSKAFTTFGLGLLADQGKVNFDAPAATYLPGLRFKNAFASGDVTLRDMLSHRTGLPRHDPVWINNRSITREELVGRVQHLEPTAPFRTTYQYNNILFTLGGHVIDRLSDMTWEDYMNERVLKPIGMTRSTATAALAARDPNHVGVTLDGPKGPINQPLFQSYPAMAPAGGIYSTVEDLARWMTVHLGRGKIDGTQIIQPATVAQLFRPTTVTNRSDSPSLMTTSYGLAWFNATYRGTPVIWHDGGLPGIITVATMVPSKNLGITVLVNQAPSELPNTVTRLLLDRMLGNEPTDWIAEAKKRKDAREAQAKLQIAGANADKVPGTRPTHSLSGYVGTYLNPGYGPVAVSLEDGRLFAKFNDNKAALAHYHHDLFEGATDDPMNILLGQRLQFQMDPEGRIAALNIPMEPSLPPIRFDRQPDARLSDAAYLSGLAGTYVGKTGKVQVSVNDGRLVFQPEQSSALQLIPGIDGEYTHPQRSDIRLRFIQDKAGRITGYRLLDMNGLSETKRQR